MNRWPSKRDLLHCDIESLAVAIEVTRRRHMTDPAARTLVGEAEKLLRDAQVQAWVLHYWSRGDSDYSTMVTCTGDPVHYGEGDPLIGYTACKEARRA